MSHQILLYLSTHQMSACQWRSGRLSDEQSFPASDDGRERFAAYLKENGRSIFSLLVNVADEGFHIETIPFLRGADRKTVIERKLEQFFFNPPLRASLSLGHEKSRRRDERVLLAALTNQAFFQPWIDILQESEVALSGLYSMPLLAPPLLRKLHLHQASCLLLTVQDKSIRQSYFHNGELHFSRLTPLQDSSIAGIAKTFAAESPKLLQYLIGQRMIGRSQPITAQHLANPDTWETSQPITAHLLAHPDTWGTIRKSCIDTPNLRYNLLDITKCAQKVGLKTLPADTRCESLFLHLLVSQPPKIQFADDDLRHQFQVGKIRSILWSSGAVALLGCLLLSGRFLFDAYSIAEQTTGLRAEASISRQRYSDIVKTFPSVPIDNETLKSVIDRYLAQETRSVGPYGLYREVSRALQTDPAVEIERLDWKIGESDSAHADPNRSTAGSRPVPVDSESIIVSGILKLPANTSTRQLLATFNHFVESFKADTKLHVEILRKPFDIESGKSLRSGDTAPEENPSRSFSLQIIRKIEP